MNLSSLEKGLIVLEQLAKPPYQYSVMELSQATGLNRTTVYRLLYGLKSQDLVARVGGQKKFKLGSKTYHLGSVYLRNFSKDDFVPQILNEISKKTSESVGYAILEDNLVLSLYESEIAQPLKMRYFPGLYYPMNRGCYGKGLMAYHDPVVVEALLDKQEFEPLTSRTLIRKEDILKEYQRIREQGYVMSKGEWADYIYGVGVPIKNRSGKVVACVALSFIRGSKDSDEETDQKCMELLSILQEYAPEFTRYLL